jgi:hypothetical protein
METVAAMAAVFHLQIENHYGNVAYAGKCIR